ncbi:MAG: phosphatidylserine decarboxylase [Firmicutes bacterium]|nr:phosphatidylserine decarboxylase [Bacillota bacterium]
MIFHRKTGETRPEKIYKSRAMRFYYQTALGGLCRLFIRLPIVSKIYGSFQKRGRSKKKVAGFIEEYNVDLSEFEQKEYASFNDFFIRKRTETCFDKDPNHLIAPADSCLLALPIENGALYSIKDKNYTLARFLKDEKLGAEFESGTCLIFRLRVYDCHRFCFIDDGVIESRKRIRGVLDSVNSGATGKFTLCSNYREVSRLKTENFGDMVVAEVGAMLVGRIVQTHKDVRFCKGGEKGYFEFGGSTIVMLLKKGVVKIDSDITEYSLKGIETKVSFGERIGVKA